MINVIYCKSKSKTLHDILKELHRLLKQSLKEDYLLFEVTENMTLSFSDFSKQIEDVLLRNKNETYFVTNSVLGVLSVCSILREKHEDFKLYEWQRGIISEAEKDDIDLNLLGFLRKVKIPEDFNEMLVEEYLVGKNIWFMEHKSKDGYEPIIKLYEIYKK